MAEIETQADGQTIIHEDLEASRLAEWLRAIADDVERRGVEPMSLSGFATIGTTEVTSDELLDGVRNFKVTRDYFLALNWRFEKDA